MFTMSLPNMYAAYMLGRNKGVLYCIVFCVCEVLAVLIIETCETITHYLHDFLVAVLGYVRAFCSSAPMVF